MSGLSQAVRNIRNIWGHGDEDYAQDEEEMDTADLPTSTGGTSYASGGSSYNPAPARSHASSHTPSYGGGGGGSHSSAHPARRLRAVPSPLRSREKNIYTIKPKSQDDACIAADYLKTGDAVIVNLEDVDRANAIRIIDFMSGVCYGLEGQGHAMKLGDAIFLYTPSEFEIRSDEVDYGENQDFFFKDVPQAAPQAAMQQPTASVISGVPIGGYTNPGNPIPTVQSIPQSAQGQGNYSSDSRRPWER